MSSYKKSDTFINPYNFVRLGEGVERKSSDEYGGNLTGKIHCVLETKTPLAIPDSENVIVGKDEHKIYSFYRVDGKPIIPGSQIRGVIRSAYETLSNSCLSVNNVNILSSRSSAIRKPGIIQFYEGKYRLFDAYVKKYRNESQANDEEIDVENEVKRVWYGQESVKRKKYNVITKYFRFECSADEVECDMLEESIADYNTNFDIYIENKNNGLQVNKAYRSYKGKGIAQIPLDKKHIDGSKLYPVFYYRVKDENGKNRVYLMPSQIGRSVYENKVMDLLGSYASCQHGKGDRICKACALFGIITKENNYASKLRFSDAVYSSEREIFEKNVTLQELSSPKISSVEFYSRKPGECCYWTYDYKIMKYKGNKNSPDEVIKSCKVELNGRKYYLHNPKLNKLDYSTTDKNKRNSTMELCEAGNRFEFDVYFEKISQEQLNELVWTLTIGENSLESKQMHKLGHGKPLGLGSVKITVDSVETRTLDMETLEYKTQKQDINEILKENPFDSESGYFNDFMLITNFETANGFISYPVVYGGDESKQNGNAIHKWFANNRKGKGSGIGWNIQYSLPEIDSGNLSLPSFKQTFNNNRKPR
ncbi:MAG: TIGR03986 family CRISPR-associated RAMP protein [Oscillospiraceae bacterium]